MAGNVRIKSPKAPPRITRMRPGMGEKEALWSSLNLGAEHSRTFPSGRPVPRNRSSRFLSRTPLFILGASSQPEGENPASCESKPTHVSYSWTDW